MKICPVCGLEVEDEARFCPRDGAVLETPAKDPLLGKVLLEQFEIEKIIGQGTTGSVYRARQLRMDRLVAIKILRPELAREAVVVERFHREAKAVAKLSHPNIITVHLVAETNDGLPYMVMEYVQGEDLQALLLRDAPLSTARIADLGAQIAEALAEAHAQGIVHRDLKPANIKLTERAGGTLIKVLDFGIAKILQEESQGKLTKTGTVFGTPYYVSPEQASGAKVDHRTDIYSLGVILFQMATGHLPFDSSSGLEVLVKHIKESPPRPSELTATVHPQLERIILRALSKNPSQRQASAKLLAEELESLTGSVRRSPTSSSKSVQTLDMTGWQDRAGHRGKSNPNTEVAKPETMLAFGGAGRQTGSVAEQVASRARQQQTSGPQGVAVPANNPVQAERRPPEAASPPAPAKDVETDGPDPKDSGVVVEPATDYASGKATSMDIRSVSKIAPAPAPVARIPQNEVTAPAARPPLPSHPEASRNVPKAPDKADSTTSSGTDARSIHPETPHFGPRAEASPMPSVSDWSMDELSPNKGNWGKTLWIFLVSAVLLGASAAAAFVWFRQHKSTGKESASQQSPTPSRATLDATTKMAGKRDAGTMPRQPSRPTVIKGTSLVFGRTKAAVELQDTIVSLSLSTRAAAGRKTRVSITFRGAIESLHSANLVTPDGALKTLNLQGRAKRYRTFIQWKKPGLHRLVLRFRNQDRDAMVWFSIQVGGGDRHRISRRKSRGRSNHAEEAADPFTDGPSNGSPASPRKRPENHAPPPRSQPPTEEGLPTPPDEPATTPPPDPEPRPSEDLPPPPPDDKS